MDSLMIDNYLILLKIVFLFLLFLTYASHYWNSLRIRRSGVLSPPFKRKVRKIQRLIQRIGTVDAQHFHDLKDRLEKVKDKEKKLVISEIVKEEEKI